ncbi:PREDICTED: vacuolar fusion protein CCZ1 homolog [Vollenhovia emeryi]|uniref:vacuolar fusion protein CCZ1 homolog n=1 Tax=Vollenhovia emeryi TaxID=411798 RepID=UPI0005F5253E|nr:PREDICTED: vacuolar fusion protein CCZ1 homolog [Vollenhovia emeryi]XP_011858302.1 PREDICTED: vacuolar fusion protein CCZ1 homolog [Vollenhovia emeryi]
MTSKPEITLEHFYIFNGTYAKKEGEEEKKILYYYPEKDLDVQIKNIGLSEAIIKFTEYASPLEERLELSHQNSAKVLRPKIYVFIEQTVNNAKCTFYSSIGIVKLLVWLLYSM